MSKPTVRFRSNLATAKITKLQRNIVGVTRDVLVESARLGQQAIVKRMLESETATGERDLARGFGITKDGRRVPRDSAGRKLTGDMIESIEKQSVTDRAMQGSDSSGRIVQKIGTTKPVEYMKYQEAINGMQSIYFGGVTAYRHTLSKMEQALRRAGKDAEANRTSARLAYWDAKIDRLGNSDG